MFTTTRRKPTQQDWSVGSTVKVGFLNLKVVAKVPTPGDFKPDAYVLASSTTLYEFVPHNGLNKITADDARALIAVGQRIAAQQAAAAIAKASEQAAHTALVESLKVEVPHSRGEKVVQLRAAPLDSWSLS